MFVVGWWEYDGVSKLRGHLKNIHQAKIHSQNIHILYKTNSNNSYQTDGKIINSKIIDEICEVGQWVSPVSRSQNSIPIDECALCWKTVLKKCDLTSWTKVLWRLKTKIQAQNVSYLYQIDGKML